MEGPTRRRALTAFGLASAALAASQAVSGTASAADPKKDKRNALGGSVGSVADLRTSPGTADGELIYLLGYHATSPGLGGGELYWDADATEADNGGTIFAVAGVSAGRWKRAHNGRLHLSWFGCTGAGTDNDSPQVQAAVNTLVAGGVIEAGTGKIRLEQTINVRAVPITFLGNGPTDQDELSTQYVVATGSANGFLLSNVHGGGFRDLVIRGSGLTGGSLVATESAPGERNYMVLFASVRFKDGYNGLTLRSCNTIRFQNCVWNGFNGQQVILLNGIGNDSRADPVEFIQCGIAAGPTNPGTDNIVIDGLGGSIKFFATAVLFGRHGIWLKNTTGGSYPKFLYFEGGGFENGHGTPVLLDAGAQAQFSNTYFSADNEHDAIRINAGFTGMATFTGCIIRGCGRNGLDIASTRVTVTGCLIGNHGRTAHTAFARTIAGASSGNGGRVRLTTGAPHGWETGDRITVQSVTGTTEANGKHVIEVINDTHFELPVPFAHAYSSGGQAYRHGAGINIRSTATRVVITGNAIGSLADGISRQDYGIVSAAGEVVITDNDLNGNLVGPYQLNGPHTLQTRVAGNRGIDQIDGWLSTRVPGATANGLYDFGSVLYLDGQRIRVLKATRKLGTGTCDVRLETDGASAGGSALGVTSTVQTTTLVSPFTIDSAGTPRRLQVRVLNAATAADLEIQFGYQVIS